MAHIVTFRTKKPLVNYLDDYFFAALYKALCDGQVNVFFGCVQGNMFPSISGKDILGYNMVNFLGTVY